MVRTVTRGLALLRGAPVMVVVVYGPPALLLAIAVVSVLVVSLDTGLTVLSVLAGRDLGLSGIPAWAAATAFASTWGLTAGVVAFPTYWALAVLWRVAHSLARPVPAPRFEPAPRSAGADAVLRITAPAPAGALPPLEPWRPLDPAGNPREGSWGGEFVFRRIGLVLSGGGAKGIYQAAAMKAIRVFLNERGAANCVVSVAGTSIGAWNTLFWLAGLVDPLETAGGQSPQEVWWTGARLSDIVQPSVRVVPGVSRHLANAEPWRRQFRAWFTARGAPGVERLAAVIRSGGPPHFYLTRTNVLDARLAFDTNFADAIRPGGLTHDMERGRRVESVGQLEDGVFLSMGIPPVFPYGGLDRARPRFEDGGVVENLPVRLATAFDRCDLLFVLPLNATFAQRDLPHLLPPRLYRVLDVRGGALERLALKQIYLFNQRYALSGERNPVPAFVIAPREPEIDTFEFWQLRRLGPRVFDQMYRATRQALDEFFRPHRLWEFFQAWGDYAKTQKLGPRGYVSMTIVPPSWREGQPLEADDRF